MTYDTCEFSKFNIALKLHTLSFHFDAITNLLSSREVTKQTKWLTDSLNAKLLLWIKRKKIQGTYIE